jgi:hypothetical protein
LQIYADKMVVMENMITVLSAERNKKIAWLSAMFECEGCFTFQYNEQKKDGRIHSHISPRVIFVNSDFSMVDAVGAVMMELGFDPYQKPEFIGGLGKKPKREIAYSGFRCLPLLLMLRPEIVGEKKECVDCMIAFIERRKKLQAEGKPKQKYDEYDFELLRRVRKINSGHWRQRPKFSDISEEAVEGRRAALQIVK